MSSSAPSQTMLSVDTEEDLQNILDSFPKKPQLEGISLQELHSILQDHGYAPRRLTSEIFDACQAHDLRYRISMLLTGEPVCGPLHVYIHNLTVNLTDLSLEGRTAALFWADQQPHKCLAILTDFENFYKNRPQHLHKVTQEQMDAALCIRIGDFTPADLQKWRTRFADEYEHHKEAGNTAEHVLPEIIQGDVRCNAALHVLAAALPHLKNGAPNRRELFAQMCGIEESQIPEEFSHLFKGQLYKENSSHFRYPDQLKWAMLILRYTDFPGKAPHGFVDKLQRIIGTSNISATFGTWGKGSTVPKITVEQLTDFLQRQEQEVLEETSPEPSSEHEEHSDTPLEAKEDEGEVCIPSENIQCKEVSEQSTLPENDNGHATEFVQRLINENTRLHQENTRQHEELNRLQREAAQMRQLIDSLMHRMNTSAHNNGKK